MTETSAEIVALKALAFLMNSEPARDRFLAASGLDVVNLRDRADDPQLLAAVMDYLLSDDELLMGFCEQESLEPKTLHLVRHRLPGG